ncbi:hypothetical protein [Salinisphaera aquimarina]|uniref:Uncharacterized protein n=1 Tax=Salinisphaera aquimarina TaxID=2094031 RepID=A0ABV7EKP6_9GAMM
MTATGHALGFAIYGLVLYYLLICALGAYVRLRTNTTSSATDLLEHCRPFRSLIISLYLAALTATQLFLHFG